MSEIKVKKKSASPAAAKIISDAGKGEPVRLNIIIDKQKRAEFKAVAAVKGEDMSSIVIGFIDQYLEQNR